MTYKDVQIAAEDARRSTAETLTPRGAHQYIDDIPFIKLSYDEIAESAFCKGAQWILLNAWKSPKESPSGFSLIIVETSEGFELGYVFDKSWSVKKWAYVKDLLPITS